MKRILTGLLASIMLVSSFPVYSFAAEGDVEINETNFPDANFRTMVSKKADTDKDGILTKAEMDAVTTLDVSEERISDITGIEYFKNIEVLKINSNQITEVDLSQNKNLKNLNCYNNKLTELDVSGCTALQVLDCSNNKLVSLDFSKNTELTKLSVNSNYSLTSLDVTKCTKLKKIYTGHTEALTELDLTNNSALETVDSSFGGLVHIYLGDSYPNLKNLGIDTNAIVEVDLSGITNTGYINVRDNALTSLDISKCLDSANVEATGNAYDIEVDDTRTFDLSTLPGKFDVTKASGWTGGTVSGNILTVNADTETVTYNYDIGKNKSASFTLNVKEKTYALGDVNMDGRVTVEDATAIQKYLVELLTEDDINLELADFNQDGKISISDATYIRIAILEEA